MNRGYFQKFQIKDVVFLAIMSAVALATCAVMPLVISLQPLIFGISQLVTALQIGVFFAISPIIALVARMKKGYWLALVFAEIYSFAGLFASMSGQLKTVYPMTAVFNISGYYDASMVQVFIGIIVLLACVVLTLFILKGLNRKAK